ncbi:hypothetical protein HPP92_014827 [Vanilla planifolia]|uniref:Uncharacterized protein n=1 Tax=Vanilla planifolia TaxID=51239 RepID=A0A835QQB0_VANPL|nr:hypothetical protein HPP92_014827 [Vanilla planifolia]
MLHRLESSFLKSLKEVRAVPSIPKRTEEQQQVQLQQEEDAIFRIINSSAATDSMLRSLESSGIQLSMPSSTVSSSASASAMGTPLKPLSSSPSPASRSSSSTHHSRMTPCSTSLAEAAGSKRRGPFSER